MKEGWEYKKLGEVCDFEGGSQPPKSEWINHSQDGYVRMLQIRDFTKSRNAEIEYVKITNKLRLCKSDDILIGRYGASVGKILTGLAGAYNVAIIKSIPNEELIRKDFIRRYFESSLFQSILFKVCTSRAAQAGFSKDDIKDELIPIPPLSEQQSIVDYLDSAFAKIDAMKANAEKALNEAKALFQASLKEMLEPKEGWEEKKLEDIGELKNGMNFNKKESGYNIHILGVGDFGNLFQIDDTDCLQTISLNSNPSEDYILRNEDIVFVRSNGNKNLVGRCVLIHVGDEPCSFSGFCIRFRKSANEVDACYLTNFLKTEDSRKKLVGNGANISNLNQKVLNEFVVLYPSLQEQQSIVETLDSLKSKVDRLQENYEKISQECDALKQAILRQVFE